LDYGIYKDEILNEESQSESPYHPEFWTMQDDAGFHNWGDKN